MNQDLRQAEKLTLSEKRLLKRHSRSAIAIMAMHTLLCVVYFQFGYFDVALEQGLLMLFVVWASLVAYQLLLATGWTLRLSEPSLSLPLVLHFMVVFMVSGYYVDEFRLSVVTLFFCRPVAGLVPTFRQGNDRRGGACQCGLCGDAVVGHERPLGAIESVRGSLAVAGVFHDLGELCHYRRGHQPFA